jgi:hypothetical protein
MWLLRNSMRSSTNPSSACLAVICLASQAYLGIVDRNMLGSPPSSLAKHDQAPAKGQPQAIKPPPASDSINSIMAGRQLDGSARAGGGGGTAADPNAAAKPASPSESNDWLTFKSASKSGSTETGFSTPWQPVKRPGGGPAMPPRGGSGGSRGARPAVRGAITPLTLPPSMPGAHTGPSSGALPVAPPPPGAGDGHHASAASNPSAPAAPTGNPGVVSPVGTAPTQPTPGTGHLSADSLSGGSGGGPLPGSTPDPVTGNSSGPALQQFTYFPMYVLDNDDGVVLFPGVDQLAALDHQVELEAQVAGTTVSSYNWNTSGITTDATSIAGASTYKLTYH